MPGTKRSEIGQSVKLRLRYCQYVETYPVRVATTKAGTIAAATPEYAADEPVPVEVFIVVGAVEEF